MRSLPRQVYDIYSVEMPHLGVSNSARWYRQCIEAQG